MLKNHTKMVTILFYVSGALQTRIGSRAPIVELQDDTASNQKPEDDEDGTGEEGGEDDAASSSSSESELNNREGGGEEDAASTSSSSESELNNWISQKKLQRVEGQYCLICCEQHYLTSTDLATFETEAQCEHIYCYVRLSSRKSASGNGNLTCP